MSTVPPPVPPPVAWGKLLALDPGTAFGVMPLCESVITIGSSPECTITIEDAIAAKHLTLCLRSDGHVQLQDHSSSGTWVNGRPLAAGASVLLSHSDDIWLGKMAHQRFMFYDLRPPWAVPPPPPPPPHPRATLLRGTSFAQGPSRGSLDDYENWSKLGNGGTGTVYRVLHRPSGVPYAIKVMEKKRLLQERSVFGLTRTRSMSDKLHSKALSEARLLKTVQHEHCIRFVDILEDLDHIFLVMEFVNGGDLLDYLKAHGPFDEPSARVLMRQLLLGLQHLHERRIVHRDLKPENILLKHTTGSPPPPPPPPSDSSPASSSAGASNASAAAPVPAARLPMVKIADFGLARRCDDSAHTFCGTKGYLAPEIIEALRTGGRSSYGASVDMWGAGVLLFILLTGAHPFCHGEQDDDSYRRITDGLQDTHFAHPRLVALSPGAKQFLKRLLDTDAKARIRVQAALQHPWIRGDDEDAPDGDGAGANGAALEAEDEVEEVDWEDEEAEGEWGFGSSGGAAAASTHRAAAAPAAAAPDPCTGPSVPLAAALAATTKLPTKKRSRGRELQEAAAAAEPPPRPPPLPPPPPPPADEPAASQPPGLRCNRNLLLLKKSTAVNASHNARFPFPPQPAKAPKKSTSARKDKARRSSAQLQLQ